MLSEIGDVDSNFDQIIEGAAVGASTGLVAFAGSSEGSVTYSLLDDVYGTFAIDAVSGAVTVANNTLLDYEGLIATGNVSGTQPYLNVTVQASDGLTARQQVFTIWVGDFAGDAVVDSDDAVADTVLEGAAVGTYTGLTAQAVSQTGAAMTYSLLDDVYGTFAIDAVSGAVTVANNTLLDYEGLIATGNVSGTQPYLNVTVQASDGLTARQQVFTIWVGDFALFDADDTPNSLSENGFSGAYSGLTIAGSASFGGPLVYSLPDDAAGAFAIDAATGVIVLSNLASINHETLTLDENGHAYVKITARVANAFGSEDKDFYIKIYDIDLIDSDISDNFIMEYMQNGSYSGLKIESIAESGNPIIYSIVNNFEGAFAIDSVTGAVSVVDSAALDYAALVAAGQVDNAGIPFVDITIRGSDGNGFEDEVFRIRIDELRLVDVDASANIVSDGAPTGTYTGVRAYLASPDGAGVMYSLAGNYGMPFSINETTGEIHVLESANFERQWLIDQGRVDEFGNPVVNITVNATNGSLHRQETFKINVEGYIKNGLYDADSGVNSVVELSPSGTYTGITARAISQHGADMRYYIDVSRSGESLFNNFLGWAIDEHTGVVTINNGGDVAWGPQHGFATTNWYGDGYVPYWDGQNLYSNIDVFATDGVDIHQRTFRVRITDANHLPGVDLVDFDIAENCVSDALSNGDYSGITVSLVAPLDIPISYSLADDAGGIFAIDAVSGEVRVSDASLVDFDTASLLYGGGDRGYFITVRGITATQTVEQDFVIRISQPESGQFWHGTGANETHIASGSGNWVLAGFGGADELVGSTGDDIISGGEGSDILTGGSGSDTFDFNRTLDTFIGYSSDVITDFVSGEDLIDLSGIDSNENIAGNQAFTYIGTNTFSFVSGQMRYDELSGDGYTHVFGDVNGDGSADFEIRLVGTLNLAQQDFLL